MKKNQLTTTKSSAVILGRSKSLMNITKKILEGSNKGLVEAKAMQDLTTHKDITIIGELMWENVPYKQAEEETFLYCDDYGERMDWASAKEYAKNLRLGGYDDWRLPTPEELLEVVTFCGGQAITSSDSWYEISIKNNANETYKANYKAKGFSSNLWTSTAYTGSTKSAWVVYLDDGNQTISRKFSRFYVRCVRVVQ